MKLKYISFFMVSLLIAFFLLPATAFSLPSTSGYLRKPFIFPVQGNVSKNFRDEYYDNYKAVWYRHTGIDIEGNPGDKVKASGNGIVAYTGFSPIGGRTIVIRHNLKIRTTYLNLENIYVSVGDAVKQGEIIASIGALDDPSGTGSHLHFGVIYGNAYLDPVQLLDIDYNNISMFLRIIYSGNDSGLY